jgi:flagellar protein FliS
MNSMQHRARAMTAYQAATETISPGMAIVMLYDGAMQALSLAKRAIAEGRIEERCNLVNKAHAIVHGLQCQLDFAAGGDIARLLDDYYAYLLGRMTQVNIKNDPAICDELVDRLREVRESWATIARTGAAALPEPAAGATAMPAHLTG